MTEAGLPTPLVSTTWLDAQLEAEADLAVLDASWYLPAQARDARAEHVARRLPGARFFDLDAVSDPSADLPHMAPAPEAFAAAASRLGIGNHTRVVVYDGAGIFSAPRVWWMFRRFGHDAVAVLDGGLPKWIEEGRTTVSGPAPDPAPARFAARPRPELIRDLDGVRAALEGAAEVVDARSGPRFRGEAPEPRPGLRAGHMPGAKNVPFGDLLEAGSTLRSPADLRAVFERAGVDLARPVVATCGSGVSAAVVLLALERLGTSPASLYDGSWAEWGRDPARPVATGEAR
jgi:thiosulfate/3-mercaptopyruvate sulfurtransferase